MTAHRSPSPTDADPDAPPTDQYVPLRQPAPLRAGLFELEATLRDLDARLADEAASLTDETRRRLERRRTDLCRLFVADLVEYAATLTLATAVRRQVDPGAVPVDALPTERVATLRSELVATVTADDWATETLTAHADAIRGGVDLALVSLDALDPAAVTDWWARAPVAPTVVPWVDPAAVAAEPLPTPDPTDWLAERSASLTVDDAGGSPSAVARSLPGRRDAPTPDGATAAPVSESAPEEREE